MGSRREKAVSAILFIIVLPLFDEPDAGGDFFRAEGSPKAYDNVPVREIILKQVFDDGAFERESVLALIKFIVADKRFFRRYVSIGKVFCKRSGGADNGCFKFVIIYDPTFSVLDREYFRRMKLFFYCL